MGAANATPANADTLARRREIVEKANKIQGLTRLITAETRREQDLAKDQYDYRKVSRRFHEHGVQLARSYPAHTGQGAARLIQAREPPGSTWPVGVSMLT